MHTLFLFLALQVATPGEMQCLGFIQELQLPPDLYVAGVSHEGVAAYSSEGQLVYLNGPRLGALKTGELYRVVRPEGKIRDYRDCGTYFQGLGTVRITSLGNNSATAAVVTSCNAIAKGDLVLPIERTPVVQFSGDLSTATTPLPVGNLVTSILVGQEDARELGEGQFCFIGAGWREGIKPGDRFVIYRYQPEFDRRDMSVLGKVAGMGYGKRQNQGNVIRALDDRTLPPLIMGDLVVVDVTDTAAGCKIINSLSEIHPGDLVIKK